MINDDPNEKIAVMLSVAACVNLNFFSILESILERIV